jgi:translation initiation factor IF-2
MAEKRVFEIAKEQGLSSREVVTRLKEAGLDVSAAASPVDEAAALKVLANGGAPKDEPKPISKRRKAAEEKAAAAKAQAEADAQEAREAEAERAAAENAQATEEAEAEAQAKADADAKARADAQAEADRAAAALRAEEETAAAAKAQADKEVAAERAAPPAPAPAPAPVAKSKAELKAEAKAEAAKQGTTPRAAAAKAKAAQAEAEAEAAPVAEPSDAPSADAAVAEGAPAAGEEAAAEGPEGAATTDKPAPGKGPRIVSLPEKRPTRGSSKGESAPGAGSGPGKRRVVIDSQAARRGPGGPGGPGGGPGGPMRRPTRRRGRRRREVLEEVAAPIAEDAHTRTDVARIRSGSTVKDVAEYLGVSTPDVIRKLMSLGEMATLTQTLADEAIQVLADEFDKKIEIVHAADEVEEAIAYDDDDEELVARAPVVVIMGHVDHGKTSLLDAIRETDVTAGEAGGITQHIGAYQVHHGDSAITFLDTPGHEAFTAMRARGAQVTDIAVIVVAADDGVKPQTKEAVDHAKAAGVPMLVAVNKIDKEGADPTRARTEMTQLGLQPSDWGGDTEFVDVSAKTREGLDTLLETIQVVADLQELRANPDTDASGVVIESKLDPGRGPVVTLLVQRGTLEVGDAIVAGANWGKVRAMQDYAGNRVPDAQPGEPVEILGFDGVPDAGEPFRVVDSDRTARTLAGERATRLKTEMLARRSGRKVSFEDVFKRAQVGEAKGLQLVLKSDVSGSLEAFEDEIAKLPQQEIHADIIHTGVGGITESDVMLASASDAVVLGFNVRPVGDAAAVAEREGVEIRTYSIIYRAIEDLRAAMEGLLEPEEVEDTIGTVEVRQIFRASRLGNIAGSYVTDGVVRRGAKVRVVRDGTVIYDTIVASLRRVNEDAREVAAGFECGIVLENFQDVKEGDVLEVYETRKVERELTV